MTRRLLLSYLTVTAAVLLLLEIPLGLFYADREVERRTAELDRDAGVIATIYEDALERGAALVAEPAERYEQRTGVRVVVVDRDGISRVDTAQPTPRDFSTRPEIAVALGGDRTAGTRPSETLGTDLLYVAVPSASGGVVHGAVRLTLDTAGTDAQIRRFQAGLVAVAVVVLATMALIGWVLARSVTRPVRQLQRAAERFASGDLRRDDDVTVGGPPELQALAATLTTMATRLALVLEEQRSFVADASHQLRTPLTALRLRLENLQSTVPEAGAAELDAAIDETDRLGRLVGDLLQLARTDQLPEPVVADLAAIAGERADTWSAVADAAAVTLGWRPPAPGERTVVQAVAGAVEQILDNVIDNAVAASGHGGTVTVTVRVVPGPRPVELAVIDHGPGLSDDDKLRALRRFWRNDAGRDGTGLGLPIAVALAEASGATLRLADTPGGGLTVVVAFAAAH